MTEQLGDYEPNHELNSSYDFEAEHLPEDEEQYYEEKVAAILAGEATWVVRDFKADHGRVYDLYMLGDKGIEEVGFIDHDYDGGVFLAYVFEPEEAEPQRRYFGNDIAKAVLAVESYR